MNWWNIQTPQGDWVAGSVRCLPNVVRSFERAPSRGGAADFSESQAKFIAKAIGGTAHEGRAITDEDSDDVC